MISTALVVGGEEGRMERERKREAGGEEREGERKRKKNTLQQSKEQLSTSHLGRKQKGYETLNQVINVHCLAASITVAFIEPNSRIFCKEVNTTLYTAL